MLDLQRLRSGNVPISPRKTLLQSCLEETVAAHRLLTNVPIRLQIEFDTNTVGWIDDGRLKQIIANGLTNAIKATEDGSIVVIAQLLEGSRAEQLLEEVRRKQINRNSLFGACRDNNPEPPFNVRTRRILRISISDTGSGLQNVDIDALFQPFTSFLAEKKDKPHLHSSGLGLPICALLASRMHGAIDLYSIRNGAEFLILVPFEITTGTSSTYSSSDGNPRTSENQSAKYVPTGEPVAEEDQRLRNLLVVDDEPTNVKLFQRMSSLLGLECEGISGANIEEKMVSALQARGQYYPPISPRSVSESTSEKSPFDIVFLDINLGDSLDGVGLLHKLKPHVQGLRFVAMTGNSGANYAETYRKAGFVGLCSKPVSLKSLSMVLQTVGMPVGRPLNVPISSSGDGILI